MVLYDFTTVKAVLSEAGITNDVKVNHYGNMADTFIYGDLVNVRNIPVPLAVVADVLSQTELDQIKNFATQIAVGYFYKFESGDEITVEEAKTNWRNWFNNKFKRPRFKVYGGELAN